MESTNLYAVLCPGKSRAVMIHAASENEALLKLRDFLNRSPEGFREAIDSLYDKKGGSMKMITLLNLKGYGAGWFTPYQVRKSSNGDLLAFYRGVFMCTITIDNKTVWLR